MITPKINGDVIKKYLNEGKRFDGRGFDEFREIIIEPNVSKKAEGSARVKIGKTEVIVGIKMDIGTPYPDSMDKGNLITSAEILPMSSDRIELGKPWFESIEIGRITDRVLRESGFIDFKGLCIKEGEKVWNLYVDIYSINDDGNLLDAAGIGAVAALKWARMPKYDEETGKADYHEHRDELPLDENVPISLTFHKVGDHFIIDPNREEEDFSETRITLGSKKGIISSIQKGESHQVSVEDFGKVLDRMEVVWKEVLKSIEKQIEKNKK